MTGAKIQIQSVFVHDSSTLGGLSSRFELLPASLRFLNTSSGVPDSLSLANQSLAADITSPLTRVAEGEEEESDATNFQIWKKPVIEVDTSTKLYGTSEASGLETGGILTKEVRVSKLLGRLFFHHWIQPRSQTVRTFEETCFRGQTADCFAVEGSSGSRCSSSSRQVEDR